MKQTVKIDSKQTLMIAHRGLSGLEKENTNLAFVAAGNRSYWGIESDVRKTADGHFVMIHDKTTERVAGVNYKVKETDFKTLREVRFKDVDESEGRVDLRIPTLEEYLHICKDYGKIAVLELKSTLLREDVKKIIQTVEAEYDLEKTVFISFHEQNLIYVRELRPNAALQWLVHKEIPEGMIELLKKYGIEVGKFNPFVPFFSAEQNHRDHRKITVVDGRVGYTGGINIGDEYINKTHPLKHWKDTAIKIKGPAVHNLTALFLETFDLYEKQPSHYAAYRDIPYHVFEEKGYVHVFGDGPRPVDEDYIGQTLYLSIINSAKKYLYIASPYFIVDTSILEAIETASKRGVDVKILTPHIPDKKSVFIMTRSSYARLIKAGVKIYEYEPGFIHSKTVLCDDRLGVVGTINFDYRSFVHNYECGAMLYGTQSILDIKRDYLQTIEENGILQTEESAKLKWYELVIKTIAVLFAPLL